MPVANGFAQGHDVGHYTLRLEAPEVCADATEAHLYLVGNADGARVSRMAVHLFEIVIGQHDLPAAA